jgi:hypothetical protein
MKRLKENIEEIQRIYFRGETSRFYGDPDYEEYLLGEQKTGLIRALVIHSCLLIESMATTRLKEALLKANPKIKKRRALHSRSKSAGYLESLLEGDWSVGMRKKIDLLRGMGLISTGTYETLVKINSVRNRAAHSLNLEGVVRKKKKRHGKKNPILNYNGKNLYVVRHFHEFMDDTSKMVGRLLLPSVRKIIKG